MARLNLLCIRSVCRRDQQPHLPSKPQRASWHAVGQIWGQEKITLHPKPEAQAARACMRSAVAVTV